MGIHFNNDTRTLTLHTAHTSYQMQVSPQGRLLHLYYGRKIGPDCLDGLYPQANRGFSTDYYETRFQEGLASPDTLPQEYSGYNTGDYRLSSLEVTTPAGADGADFRYVSHSVQPGKYALEGLPTAHDEDGEAETLVVTLEDACAGLRLELFYGVFAQQDMLTRAARLSNTGKNRIVLEKAASVCLDIPFGRWDYIHFHGRHAMERQYERRSIANGIQTVSSKRGASSHHHNPFVILCDHQATEDAGGCYGVMPVYSGSHRTDIELDQTGAVRIVSGIHDELFRWTLEPGESFTAPEVLLTYTHQGLTSLSQRYHRFLRRNICRGPFRETRRPVLINNWEATFFDFDSEKIYGIAKQASELGVELMVLDDGWFGKRDDDNSGLGDWFVNEKKLPGGLDPLIEKIHGLGMKFGLWVEPEMVSEDSDLYRAHPDWALTLPDRAPAMCRKQLVLDLGREEVVDHLTAVFSGLLRNHRIDYVKWDMNRNMSDVYSRALPAGRQGEAMHRYMLGVYRLLENLTVAFPHVLFEGCAGGGGRFDAGMLAYFPQSWCSDNTDAVERLTIQYGTSFGYPVSTVGSHVSVSPNQQTGRSTLLGTRGVVAMAGTFGYELNPNELSAEEKEEVRAQIAYFKAHYDLIQSGDYYRLTDLSGDFTAWQHTAPDGAEALVSLVVSHPRANPKPLHLPLKGLIEDAFYRIADCRMHCRQGEHSETVDVDLTGRSYSGAALMYAGLTLPQLYGDSPSIQLHLIRTNRH